MQRLGKVGKSHDHEGGVDDIAESVSALSIASNGPGTAVESTEKASTAFKSRLPNPSAKEVVHSAGVAAVGSSQSTTVSAAPETKVSSQNRAKNTDIHVVDGVDEGDGGADAKFDDKYLQSFSKFGGRGSTAEGKGGYRVDGRGSSGRGGSGRRGARF